MYLYAPVGHFTRGGHCCFRVFRTNGVWFPFFFYPFFFLFFFLPLFSSKISQRPFGAVPAWTPWCFRDKEGEMYGHLKYLYLILKNMRQRARLGYFSLCSFGRSKGNGKHLKRGNFRKLETAFRDDRWSDVPMQFFLHFSHAMFYIGIIQHAPIVA